MAQIGFIVSVPHYVAADLGTYNKVGEELARLIAADLPISDGVRFLSNVKSNNPLHIDTTLDVVDPISTSGYIKLVSQAGAAAGSTAVTGAVATSVLLAVFASNDTTHAVTNVTAEWVANPATAGHFDNTGGADNTGSHVLFVFYNPPADVEHILP